jgi:ketosteroid isomerase-like protein
MLLAVAMLVGAGCNNERSDADEVKAVVENFLDAAADGKGEEACSYLTGDAVRFVSTVGAIAETEASCPDAVNALAGRYATDEKEALKGAKVKEVSVSGDRATIARQGIEFNYQGESRLFPKATTSPVTLTKTDAGWKIESLG